MSEEALEEIKYYSEMYPDGIHKKSQAEEMFKELGYELYELKTYMFYEKKLKAHPEFENDYVHIEFNFISETVNKSYGDDNTVADITLEELQAINKQIEELGWNK